LRKHQHLITASDLSFALAFKEHREVGTQLNKAEGSTTDQCCNLPEQNSPRC